MADGGAPRTAANGPAPSKTQSAPNLVQFDPKLVVPSQPLYLQRNDQIAFNLLTNGTNISVRFNYRWLTPAGEIQEGEFNTPPTTGAGFFTLGIYEGWLLSFAARVTSGAPLGQWTFIQALITRSNLPNAQSPMHALFWSGFIYSFTANGWPGLPSKENAEGPGVIRSIQGSVPGAGLEIQETVPAQRRWLLLSFQSFLTTNATVANRNATFSINDGAAILWNSPSFFNQVASTSSRYVAAPQPTTVAALTSTIALQMNLPFPLKTGFSIRSITANIQATDVWTAPQYSVLEWGQWDS